MSHVVSSPSPTLAPPVWEYGRGRMSLQVPRIMAVLNLTPDSFFDGGKMLAPGADRPNVSVVVRRARELVRQGAAMVDVGGESTRPGAAPVDRDRQLGRIMPVLEALIAQLGPTVPISVDTRDAEVAREALAGGASIVNDISGLHDPAMADVVAAAGAGVVIGHMRGDPETMQQGIAFGVLVDEVAAELVQSVETARRAGVEQAQIVVDPGIGFGKTAEQNAALIAWLDRFVEATGCPVLVGASRKSFLGQITGCKVEDRLISSVAAAIIAAERGAAILRVHDVAATREGLEVAQAIRGAGRRFPPRAMGETRTR